QSVPPSTDPLTAVTVAYSPSRLFLASTSKPPPGTRLAAPAGGRRQPRRSRTQARYGRRRRGAAAPGSQVVDLARAAGGGQRGGEQNELVDHIEEHEQPDRAGDDLVGRVGLGALYVEPAEGLEQLQAGGHQKGGPSTRRSGIRSRGSPVSTATDSTAFTPTPNTSATAASSHRASASPVPAALTSRLANAVVTNATASEAASSNPSPASTSRSTNTRTYMAPGYSGSPQTLRIEDRSASTQNQPVTGRPTNAITPTVPR